MSARHQPTKHEIGTVLTKLKSLPSNKQCFDCGGSNPTWASVTYGVFLCIDCSAVHRSLGVHLSFIRSTQLDTNWTWVQLRAMQVGGNENARSFFSQHNCRTSDAQEKYQSRAAELYRTKLEKLAVQAMKVHGTKLLIDIHEDKQDSPLKKDTDFFEEHTSEESSDILNGAYLSHDRPTSFQSKHVDENITGPAVDELAPSTVVNDRPYVIGTRKPKQSRMGARKGGLGAAKVKTDFSAIEMAAENADLQKERQTVLDNKVAQERLEKEAERIASLRLSYKEMTDERDRKEDAIKSVDPKRAEQVERLGMSTAHLGTRGGVTHSAFSSIQKIEQEGVAPTNNRSSVMAPSDLDLFISPNSFTSGDRDLGLFGSSRPRQDDPFARTPTSRAADSSWADDWTVVEAPGTKQPESNSRSATSFSRDYPRLSEDTSFNSDWNRSNKAPSSYAAASTADSEALRKKFGNATSISSDAYFGRDEPEDPGLGRFQGNSSISSDDYFGRSKQQPSHQLSSEMQQIKDGVRQGVTKVASRLSTFASGMVTSIQDRLN